MRKFTSLLNLFTTFALLGALYTGLDTITHKTTDPAFHGFVAFITFFIASFAMANSMLYINTLHKEIEELKKVNGLDNSKELKLEPKNEN
jgi:hypothetical protein